LVTYFTKNGFENYYRKISELEKEIINLKKCSQENSDSIILVGYSLDRDPILEELTNMESHLLNYYSKINEAKIIEYPKNIDGKVVLGCKVNINLNGQEKNYEIVAFDEDNLEDGKISYNSPIAKSLIGKKINDNFEVNLPKSKINIKILNIMPIK
jgi:transcription elongation factor GreA